MEFNATEMKELNAALKKAFEEMQTNVNKVQDTAMKALEETRAEGTLHKKTNDALTDLGKTGNELAEGVKELKTRILEVEQKLVKNPAGAGDGGQKSIGELVIESEQYKAASKNTSKPSMDAVQVGSFHKTNVVNATGQNQPLVPSDRRPGIIMPALRRLTIRNLIPNNRTTSNLVEFASELLFTSNAGAQGGSTSPVGNGEGELKQESALTFQLSNTPVCLIAHFIPASRQILADAPMLQGYVDGRLRYGVALKEETDLLNGDGGAGALNGLVNQATAFTGGVTNQTALDTLLKAFLQISLQNLEASGVILHPTDWTNIMLLKDTTGRYLFSDPHSTELPRVWGKDVVATASQTLGQFLAGAFTLAAEIFDREDATVRVAEQHADFFVRNMVAILAEERLALAVYRSAALVNGAISNAG
ncbi:MAG: phage major capsid protein [Sulfuricaulis sp.]|nr:phage major capsid protein [Sulfuricaulis sp.]